MTLPFWRTVTVALPRAMPRVLQARNRSGWRATYCHRSSGQFYTQANGVKHLRGERFTGVSLGTQGADIL